MRRIALVLVVAAGLAAAPAARQLKPKTLAGWEQYLARHDVVRARAGDAPFLWVDRQPEPARSRLIAALARGEVVVERLRLRDDEGDELKTDDGLIHHWVGTVRIPGATLDEVIAFVQDYDRYPEHFGSMIPQARVLSRDDNRWTVAMRNRTKKVITVVIDADYVVDYVRLSPTRLETTNVATNIFEVKDAGTEKERRIPADETDGYLWRFRMLCRFEQRDDATFEECESLSLTRGVPLLLKPFVSPFVNSVPRETIEKTLGAVRDGVAGR